MKCPRQSLVTGVPNCLGLETQEQDIRTKTETMALKIKNKSAKILYRVTNDVSIHLPHYHRAIHHYISKERCANLDKKPSCRRH